MQPLPKNITREKWNPGLPALFSFSLFFFASRRYGDSHVGYILLHEFLGRLVVPSLDEQRKSGRTMCTSGTSRRKRTTPMCAAPRRRLSSVFCFVFFVLRIRGLQRCQRRAFFSARMVPSFCRIRGSVCWPVALLFFSHIRRTRNSCACTHPHCGYPTDAGGRRNLRDVIMIQRSDGKRERNQKECPLLVV